MTIAIGHRSGLLAEALAQLARQHGANCVGIGATGSELARLSPDADVVVCELALAIDLYSQAPDARAVIICEALEPETLRLIVRHGPLALLGPEATSRDFVDAVRAALSEAVTLSPSLATAIAAQAAELSPKTRLTTREIEVLQRLAEGESNREIAEVLRITVRTAAAHVSNILDKLGAENRTRAVAFGLRSGLVRVPATQD